VKKLIVIVWFIWFPGCLPGSVAVHPVAPKHELLYSYTYENVQRTAIGEPMVYKVDGWAVEGFVSITSFQPDPDQKGDLRFAQIDSGSLWPVIGKTAKGDLICLNEAYPRPLAGKGLVPVPWRFCLVVNELGDPYGYAHCNEREAIVQPWPRKYYNFLKKQDRLFVKGSFKQEFVYISSLKDKIILMYREYQDDLKQPSYAQKLVFDLSQSPIIGFRGMHMEVLEATSSYIRFVVKTPFDAR
jgi:hypothetical protein